jgi:hypothetical protein
MTKAVCFSCGDIKFGAFNPCSGCGETPRVDGDLILSLAMTDHYFNDSSLKQLGDSVKAGSPPKLDENTRSNLLKILEEFKKSPAGQIFPGLKPEQKSEVKPRRKWWSF